MPAPVVEAETATLNLLWLLSARELARTDADRAALVYGLDRELVTALGDATLAQLHRAADAGVLLFRPRFRQRVLCERLKGDGASSVALDLHSVLLAAEEVAHR
jgi:hypothetical protein